MVALLLYNLTVVVDDIDMGITNVIRGDDHLNNTLKTSSHDECVKL